MGKHEEAVQEMQEEHVASARRCKRVFRVVDLPSEIAPDTMNVTLRDGLLDIQLTKAGIIEKEREVAKAAAA
jgi:HSP20 family molecular chaperone IbpA